MSSNRMSGSFVLPREDSLPEVFHLRRSLYVWFFVDIGPLQCLSTCLIWIFVDFAILKCLLVKHLLVICLCFGVLLWSRNRILWPIMDPAEIQKVKQAISSQGALVGQHENALSVIMDKLLHLSTSMTQLDQRLNQVATQLSALADPVPPSSPPVPVPPEAASPAQPYNPREPFIPTPDRYSGELGSCSQFLYQCSLVFDQQPLTYSSDRSKIAFVCSLLFGRASAWALAMANANSPAWQSYLLFCSELRKVFDHPLQSKEAGNRLLSLRQGSHSVADYSVEFRILAIEAGWDEKALQGIFMRGLREELKDELAARDETSSLEELISLAIRLDNRLCERRRERAASSRVPLPLPKPFRLPGSLQPHPLQEAPSPSVVTPAAPSSPVPEEPMQLGRMKLSPAERQRRLLQRLCVYCGAADHYLANCPARPKDQAHQPPRGRW